jgi:ABC-type Mn2+/Zn2+ transport system permease subunit
MLLAAMLSTVCAAVGLVASYLLHASSGASIVLACTAAFALTGVVARVGRRFRRPDSAD